MPNPSWFSARDSMASPAAWMMRRARAALPSALVMALTSTVALAAPSVLVVAVTLGVRVRALAGLLVPAGAETPWRTAGTLAGSLAAAFAVALVLRAGVAVAVAVVVLRAVILGSFRETGSPPPAGAVELAPS